MAKQFTLGKNERLKSRKIIEQLFSDGKSFVIPPFRVHYVFNTADISLLQFGVGVSSRNFKKAVDRNRIKRIAREAWRLQKSTLQQELEQQNRQLHVFIIYTGKKIPDYKETFDTCTKILHKLSGMLVVKK